MLRVMMCITCGYEPQRELFSNPFHGFEILAQVLALHNSMKIESHSGRAAFISEWTVGISEEMAFQIEFYTCI